MKEIPNVSHTPGEQGICPHVAAPRAVGKSVQRDEVGRISDALEYIHKYLGCRGNFGTDLIMNTTKTKQMKE